MAIGEVTAFALGSTTASDLVTDCMIGTMWDVDCVSEAMVSSGCGERDSCGGK